MAIAGAVRPVTEGAGRAVVGGEFRVLVVRGAGERRRRATADRSSPRWTGVAAPVGAVRGARPVATERGSEERPTRWPASWLAAQASVALTAIPRTAATAVATDRRVIGRGGYARSG